MSRGPTRVSGAEDKRGDPTNDNPKTREDTADAVIAQIYAKYEARTTREFLADEAMKGLGITAEGAPEAYEIFYAPADRFFARRFLPS
jgi:hypothetical protein